MTIADLTTGTIFAGYQIDGVAGEGGMGVVYRATEIALQRPVALKLIAEDFAGDRKFRERFGCERILHRDDVVAGTREVEIKLDGDAPVPFDDEIRFIPVPGHTPGSTCMLYRGRFLFSGDHAWSDAAGERVVASHRVCWYDWDLQSASMARLADYRFEWLLPGHGLRCRLPTQRMHDEVERCVGRMKRVRAIAR